MYASRPMEHGARVPSGVHRRLLPVDDATDGTESSGKRKAGDAEREEQEAAADTAVTLRRNAAADAKTCIACDWDSVDT